MTEDEVILAIHAIHVQYGSDVQRTAQIFCRSPRWIKKMLAKARELLNRATPRR